MFRIMSNLARLRRHQKYAQREKERVCPWLFYAPASDHSNEKEAQFFRALAQNGQRIEPNRIRIRQGGSPARNGQFQRCIAQETNCLQRILFKGVGV
jgi:hypothetical protein